MFAVRVGLQKFNVEHKFEIASIITLYANWIKEGKLKVSSDWNKERQIKFTVWRSHGGRPALCNQSGGGRRKFR